MSPALDHRRVHLEVLREFVRSYSEVTSIRSIAQDAGVNRSSVHRFITAGTTPHPRVRRLLALWYLRAREGVGEIELIRPYAQALTVLVFDVPEPAREIALTAVLNEIGRGFGIAGEGTPQWVEVLKNRVGYMLDSIASVEVHAEETVGGDRRCETP